MVVLVVMVLLLPVPWLHLVSEDPPGTAWRLDGRLEIDGEMIDPPGRWTWLAVGRPPLVAELVRDRLLGRDSAATDLRDGPVTRRPTLSEPAAVAVGLRHAGHELPLGVLVEVRQPLLDGYPQGGLLEAVNGAPLTDRQAWEEIAGGWSQDRGAPDEAGPLDRPGGLERPGSLEGSGDIGSEAPGEPAVGEPVEVGGAGTMVEPGLTFRFRSGQRFSAPGPGLPYADVIVSPTAPETLSAGITFAAARLIPGDAGRNLSLGSSHGMMVALMAYADASGHDLAQGRHIAGTGGILGDGTVQRIGGLPAKARAANRAGADVLLVPRSQAVLLEGLSLPGTTVVPVSSLREAIDWLGAPVA
jgi:hypothetical protein